MKFWSCCHSRGFEPGCTTGPTHVLEMEDASRLADLCPFESTPSPANTTDNVTKIQKVITLDCEMSYTKYGLALSRMSVLSFPDCKVLEDTFVREPYPGVPFLDYNTQISGVIHENIYPDDPENSPPVLEGITTARSKLWEYCDENTIIIGHGLDHDLKCLRMLHPKIIDTAILFSKIEGQKPGLKKLAEAELRWCIQDVVDLTGHDSVEDCRACIELVLKYLQRPTVAAESPASEIPD
ncbi:ribonuclease H-like domain-containing protein [Tirmania nivea]|nr:ribonuclease H-like domain-containing protein [Tirmania nivea]